MRDNESVTKEDLGINSRYKKLGFMCGLEIHQRLATKEKLFCSCMADIKDVKDGPMITRRQRAVAGELGEIDRSAKFEELKERSFGYVIAEGHACLVDIDEEPPRIMNEEALSMALKLAASMRMKIPEELEPMRKEVVDGSNPSAFQRSTLVGLNGSIRVNGNDISIPSMFLEEESAGIISNSDSNALYDTSRIGIPLIEIDTFPYIKTPKDAKDVALYIGTLLRLTGFAQRGIGSIRQDVNVSITNGSRIEIKGLQELYDMDKYIENEVNRQEKLLEISALLKSRKADVDTNGVELTHIFKETLSKIISSALNADGIVLGFRLKNFAGIIGMEINPEKRLGTEISDYAKMAGVRGIIHSDEDMHKYSISASELEEVRKRLQLENNDAFVMVAAKRDMAEKAIKLAMERAKYAISTVPAETRAVDNKDLYTTRFMRPLPGGSRMYPETDTKPVVIDEKMLEKANSGIISVDAERKRLVEEIGSADLAERMMLSQRLALYRIISSMQNSDRQFAANVLLQKFREIKREGLDPDAIPNGTIEKIFSLYFEKKITKQAVEELIRQLAKNPEGNVEDIISRNDLLRKSGDELAKLVNEEFAASKNGEHQAFIKYFMSKYRLNVDGSELNSLLGKTGRGSKK